MTNLERKARVMDILDTWLLHTSKVKYANVIVLGEDHVNSDDEDIIGLHFEMSMLDYEMYNEGLMDELVEVVRECGYEIEWYNSVEMHLYPEDDFQPMDGWENYLNRVYWHHC